MVEILTNLFSFDFVVLQNSLNFDSIFLGSDLISFVKDSTNLFTVVTHTIKKKEIQNKQPRIMCYL